MAYATGTRLTAYACFLVGLTSVVGIPVLWPIGYWLIRHARGKEHEREQELQALGATA